MREEISLPNGQFVLITYLQDNDTLAMPDRKYSCPYRKIELFEKEEGKKLGERIEQNPYYNPKLVTMVFDHLNDVEFK